VKRASDMHDAQLIEAGRRGRRRPGNRTEGFALAAAVAVALGAAVAACGPKPVSTVTPTLPGEGDEHTAKPGEVAATPPAADPWAGRTDLIKAPPPPAPEVVNLPPVERFTLKNGLQVILVRNNTLPVVDMQLAVKAGRADERREKVGLSDFVAQMLTRGVKGKDAQQIARSIEFVGGQIRADASYEATLLSCSALAKDTRTCLDLLPAMVADATFPASEIEEVRERLRGAVRARKDDAGAMASAHFQNALWGDDHPRGWSLSDATVEAIQRADLVAWRDTWFKPGNALLAVSGDVDSTKLRANLEKAFGRWRPGKVPARADHPVPDLAGARIRLVDKPKQTQTHIRLGHFGVAHTDPRFYDTLVFNYILGGGELSSRLLRALRVDAGKSYAVSSSFDRNIDRGAFLVSTFTRTAETLPTVKLIADELIKMKTNGPTDAEVADAETNIAGSYGTRFESAGAIASALLAAELHGYHDDYVRNFGLEVGKVTVASARKAAAAVLDTENYVLVLVGDASKLEPQLKQAGLAYQKLSYSDPISKYEREVPADPKSEAAGRKILEAALAAKGGEAKLKAMKSLVIHASGELAAQGRKLPAKLTRTFVAPDSIRVDLDIAGGSFKVTYTLAGKAGWAQQGKEIGDLGPPELAVLDVQRWRDQEMILLHAGEAGTKVAKLPDETIDGVALDVVHLERGDGKVAANLYFDKKTKMLVRMVYDENGGRNVETYGGYKAVSGIQIAHTRSTSAPDTGSSVTIDTVEINGTVDPAIFNKP